MEKIYGESLKEIAQAIINVYGLTKVPERERIEKILDVRCNRANLLLCAMREEDMPFMLCCSLDKLLCCPDSAASAINYAVHVAREVEGMFFEIAPTVQDYIDKILHPEDFKCESEAA